MATGGGGGAEVGDGEEKRVLCSVCMEVFKDPRFLPCFHTFCLECLEPLAERHRLQMSFPCPECRRKVRIPPEGVSSFQKNFYIMKKDLEAALNQMAEAQATAGQEASSETGIDVNDVQLTEELVPCPEHPMYALNLYCVPCQVPVCHQCGEHAQHKDHAVVPWTRAVLEALNSGNSTGRPAPTAWISDLVHTWQDIINTSFGYNGNQTRRPNQALNSLSASVDVSTRSVHYTNAPGTSMEMSIKLLLFGDCNVGKTALFKLYCRDQLLSPLELAVTISSDVFIKVIQWSPELKIKLQVWDTPGYEMYKELVRVHYRNADGCLLLFDLTDEKTLAGAASWKDELDRNGNLADGSRVPCILVGNKKDERDRVKVTEEQASRFSNLHRFHACRFISVKTKEGVDDIFKFLLEEVIRRKLDMENKGVFTDDVRPSIRINGPHQGQPRRKCAC